MKRFTPRLGASHSPAHCALVSDEPVFRPRPIDRIVPGWKGPRFAVDVRAPWRAEDAAPAVAGAPLKRTVRLSSDESHLASCNGVRRLRIDRPCGTNPGIFLSVDSLVVVRMPINMTPMRVAAALEATRLGCRVSGSTRLQYHCSRCVSSASSLPVVSEIGSEATLRSDEGSDAGWQRSDEAVHTFATSRRQPTR